jgi:V/A-type H+-transporting ATPase subunit A
VFWGLDYNLSYKRHFPAINWLQSYSLYQDKLSDWYRENISRDWNKFRADTMRILQEEAELQEIVQLVGIDALSPADRVTLEAARSIREDYLQQDAFNEDDTYTTLDKQYRMLKIILAFYEKSQEAIKKGVDINDLFSLPVRVKISRMKLLPQKEGSKPFDEIEEELSKQIEALYK